MDFMKMAYELAKKGLHRTYPNPMVGAIIVHDNKIIGRGYHEKYGQKHAERNALDDAYESGYGPLISNSIMYVTLEPCNHYGKTPPCLELILNEGIKEVHISMLDVNPLMQGKSVDLLRKNGVNVICGYMEDYGKKLNAKFINRFKNGMPYVSLKTATTLDGKIASKDYDSKWITCHESRKKVHELRADNDGVLTTYKTLNIDKARLNVRHIKSERSPVPIIVDKDLKSDFNLELFDIHKKVIIITSKESTQQIKIQEIDKNTKSEIVYIAAEYKENEKKLNLRDAFAKLKEYGIHSVMIESGSRLAWELVKEDLVDEYYSFIAPKILGGEDSISSVGGLGYSKIANAKTFEFTDLQMLGSDILVRGRRICSQE